MPGTATGFSKVTTDRGVQGGTALAIGGLAYQNTAASTAISNTATETAFSTVYNTPANSLTAGTVVRIRFHGIATSTNSTDTLTIKLKIGGSTTNTTGTAVITTSAVDVANNDIFTGYAELVIRTDGASGTMVACGLYSDPGAQGSTCKAFSLASTAIDTTVAQPIKVTATWSAASASDSCRLDILSIQILGGA